MTWHHCPSSRVYGKMNQIDIGIALTHLWLSCGYEFMAKVKVGSL